ncbi:MAG TPA: hypothetical protein VM010_07070, partial [Chitinophagaceae bacterium]|nr:hypothetical protein [Chitinophagaceae bacterium]
MKFFYLKLWLCLQLLGFAAVAQNISINATGNLPDPKAILDITSTTSGLLIPRMTTAERNAITAPPNGLQVYNTTTGTLDLYRSNLWEEVGYGDSSVKVVRSLADLPAPVSGEILLDSTKTYKFSGLVNISPNYLNTNGAALVGTNAIRDGVLSTVSGGILRSTDKHVFIEKLLIVPYAAATKAFDFSDPSGQHSCNLLTGINIKDAAVASAGVGQVSGFRAVIILQNYWNTAGGIKVTGKMGRFICGFTLIGNITNGAGIEFLSGLTIDDIDLSNNHFVYTGQTGVKVATGAVIDRGRMTTNIFRGVTLFLDGFDSYSPAWEMQQNTSIPNSKAFAYAYMNDNLMATSLPATSTYYKIAGTSTAISAKRFTHTDNRFTYFGRRPVVARMFVVVGGKAPTNSVDFTIAIAKNGVI